MELDIDLKALLLLIAAVFGIFSIVIVITRFFGLRTFAKMSSFDFASTIAIGSVLASTILNKNQSFLHGAIALTSIVLFQTLFALTIRKISWFKALATNKPQVLIWKGEILNQQLKKCNIDESDLMAKLREANVHKLANVQVVVLENTGDVSVLHSSEYEEVDPILLRDIDTSRIT